MNFLLRFDWTRVRLPPSPLVLSVSLFPKNKVVEVDSKSIGPITPQSEGLFFFYNFNILGRHKFENKMDKEEKKAEKDAGKEADKDEDKDEDNDAEAKPVKMKKTVTWKKVKKPMAKTKKNKGKKGIFGFF